MSDKPRGHKAQTDKDKAPRISEPEARRIDAFFSGQGMPPLGTYLRAIVNAAPCGTFSKQPPDPDMRALRKARLEKAADFLSIGEKHKAGLAMQGKL